MHAVDDVPCSRVQEISLVNGHWRAKFSRKILSNIPEQLLTNARLLQR